VSAESFVDTIADIMLAIIVILAIFGVLYFVKGDWGMGFFVILLAGIAVFFRTYITEKL